MDYFNFKGPDLYAEEIKATDLAKEYGTPLYVYSKATCVSPHIYPMYKQLKKDWHHEMVPESEVYISWGGYEYDTHRLFATVTDQNLQIITTLMRKEGVDVYPHVFKNDNHSEASWQKELPVWMKDLNLG